jgi:hypothetical protein
MSSIHIDALTENQLNQYLESRHSRTSGTLTQKRERLRRFLELENQKQRRTERVSERKRLNSEDADVFHPRTLTLEDIQAADTLCSLRARQITGNTILMLEHNIQLLTLISQLGDRVTALENDVLPDLIPLVYQDSNPQWTISESETHDISSTAP